MKKQLLIGCGSNREKRMTCDQDYQWGDLTTLDNNPDHKPDFIWDLTDMPLPFMGRMFDEIHAYEVLEHTGAQGDYKFFFKQFEEFHRILKPDGHLLASVPLATSRWAWGDPSHTRVITPEQLIFLCQSNYKQVGKTAMSDFRNIYKADFEIVYQEDDGDTFYFILRAIK